MAGETSSSELDKILQHFFAQLRKKDGTNYEPDSLRMMLGALDRYFRNAGYNFRIIKDKEFTECRQVLNGKAIELREMGMGKRKNKADVLTEEEEEIMWSKGVLGDGNPKSLNYTIFYMTSQHFGTHGPLYLTPLQHFQGKDVWYTLSPVKINQIDHFMKTMTKLIGLETTQKNFTNHSVRKMLV